MWAWAAPAHFGRHADPDARELGAAGERLAARWLRARGWRVRARNLRTASGEIDLVVERGGLWRCVEVKSAGATSEAWSARFRAADHLDRAGWARRQRAARALGSRLPGGKAEALLIEVRWSERGIEVALHAQPPGLRMGR